MLSYYGNALDDLDAAIAEDPTWALAHVMKANALLSMTEHGLGLLAADSLQRAAELAAAGHANERERRHIAATRACAAGQWQQACDAWERILLDHPQDLVALQIAHLFDFYRGDARNLHRRVARVLPEWSPQAPLYSFVLGMHAFGLEECNLYPHALDAGQAALALDARDPWAVHAVTHVHEMQGRFDEGARFLASRSDDWSPDNGFAYHNWWHLALFHLERCDTAGALALLDERVMPGAEVRAAAHRHQRPALAAAADGRRPRRALGAPAPPAGRQRPKPGTTPSTTCTPCCRWSAPAGSTTPPGWSRRRGRGAANPRPSARCRPRSACR